MSPRSAVALAALATAATATGETPRAAAFTAVVLGASGGLDESDLSAVLLAPVGQPGRTDWIVLDAGTLRAGFHRARAAGSLPPPSPPADEDPLAASVRAYLITHPHLDHVAGLVLNSPEDGPKPILGLASTLDALREHLFNGSVWANFTDEGPGALGRYHLTRLELGRETRIPGTRWTVEAYPLAHAGGTSTAFLVRDGGAYALYLGDTGPDELEHASRLAALWERIGPRVRDRSLRAIFIECSYADGRPDGQLFGHLTPAWLFRELHRLAARIDPAHPELALRDLPIVIGHVKPSERGPAARETVAAQLAAHNDLGVRLLVPIQGARLDL